MGSSPQRRCQLPSTRRQPTVATGTPPSGDGACCPTMLHSRSRSLTGEQAADKTLPIQTTGESEPTRAGLRGVSAATPRCSGAAPKIVEGSSSGRWAVAHAVSRLPVRRSERRGFERTFTRQAALDGLCLDEGKDERETSQRPGGSSTWVHFGSPAWQIERAGRRAPQRLQDDAAPPARFPGARHRQSKNPTSWRTLCKTMADTWPPTTCSWVWPFSVCVTVCPPLSAMVMVARGEPR